MSIILEAIKRAIRDSGRSRYAIAKETGVSEAQLSKLVNNKVGLNIETAERLAAALGLKISISPAKRRSRSTKGR